MPPVRPTVRIRSRRALIGVALLGQAVILAVGWASTFLVVRDTFARSVEERIITQNTDLAGRVAALLPELMGTVAFGTPEWERLQTVVEGLDELPAGGFACLLDENGNILCHPDIRNDPSLRGVNLSNEGFERPKGAADGGDFVQPLASVNGPASGRIRFGGGNTHYVATDVISGTGHRLLVHQPVADLVDAGRTTTRLVIVSALCTGIVVLLLAGGGLALLVRSYEGQIEVVARRLQGEIDLAHEIQQGTFPTSLPEAPGISIAGWSIPAEETGGDTWDAFTAADGSIVLMLADATGHGVGPALSVTQLRAMLRMAARSGTDLARIATDVNDQLHADLPGARFITAWLARLDPATRSLDMLSAGQAPILRWIAAEERVVEEAADTWPLGVMGHLGGAAARRVDLAPGDVVAILSDGIFEATGPGGGEDFGFARAAKLLAERAAAGDDATDIAAAIRTASETFASGSPAADDRTVLVIRAQPVPSARATPA